MQYLILYRNEHGTIACVSQAPEDAIWALQGKTPHGDAIVREMPVEPPQTALE